MSDSNSSLARAFAVCLLAYLAALAAAVAVARALAPGWGPLAAAAWADVAATAVVFAFSVAFSNSSLYDPYWSVAPVPLAVYWASTAGPADRIRQALALGLVAGWALRLTWNWARGWRGLSHEDWRYRDIREATGRFYWPVSFLGIHLMPTVMVFLGCLPLHAALTAPGRPLGALDLLAALVTATAIWIEATADAQLARFVASKPEPGALLTTGLWAWSRHPNYFGEVLFWWGLGLFGVAAAPERWWVLGGPAAITALFWFISIPMMDRHMTRRRPAYAQRVRQVSRLVPWPPSARIKEEVINP